MYSINLFLVYAGPLPNYFNLFLTSCEKNPTVNWTVLSTEESPVRVPANVRWEIFSIQELRERIRKRIGIDTCIVHPYKICDFRPALGELYPEFCDGYDFWGHCDADVVFGDLRKFIADEVLNVFLKVQMRGAFSLYRNNDEGNSLYRLPHPKINFREAFENPRYCAFDEWEGLFKILRVNRIPIYFDNAIAEIAVGRYDLRLSHHNNFLPQVFAWDSGRLFRASWQEGKREDQEFSYIHLQKRKFCTIDDLDIENRFCRFCFLPNRLAVYGSDEELKMLAKENRPNFGHDLWFSIGRPLRWLRSRRLVDRQYYKIPKVN